MNERIRELAIQAAGKGFKTFATSDFDSQEKIQKFAESVIMECAKFLDEKSDHDDFVAKVAPLLKRG